MWAFCPCRYGRQLDWLFFVAFYRGKKIIPGLALGTFCANYLSLGGTFVHAICISMMNSVGPVVGASILKRRVTPSLIIKGKEDIVLFFLTAIILTPFLTALGGIGSKCILNSLSLHICLPLFFKWMLAHASGTLFFGVPAFVWFKGKKKYE